MSAAAHERRKQTVRIADRVRPAGSQPMTQQRPRATQRVAGCLRPIAACTRAGKMPLEVAWFWDRGVHMLLGLHACA